MGVADIEHPGHAVVPGVHPQQRVIRGDGNVHGQRNLLGDADVRNRLRVPVAAFIFVDQPDLGGQGGGGEAVIVLRTPGATDFQRRARHVQHLLRLAFVQVPDHHGIAEALHGFRVRHHLPQVHHVIVPAGEGRGHHDVAARQHAHVITVTVGKIAGLDRALQVSIGGHPVRGDVLPVVGVFHHARAPAVVLVVGQPGNQHPAGHGVTGVRADHAAALVHKVADGLVQTGFGRVRVYVKNKNPVGIQARGPQVAPVVGQARVVGLVAPAHGQRVDDLAVVFRLRVDVNGNQLVLLVAQALHAQGPDIHEVLLADDFRHVRRHAGLVRGSRRRD